MGNDSNSSHDHDIRDTPENLVKPTKRDRKEYMARYYAENKDEITGRKKAYRFERRDEINAAARENYANDPAAREQRLKINAKGRNTYKERVANDPNAQKLHEERLAKRRLRHKERLATDLEYRTQREKFAKFLREKRKKLRSNENDETGVGRS